MGSKYPQATEISTGTGLVKGPSIVRPQFLGAGSNSMSFAQSSEVYSLYGLSLRSAIPLPCPVADRELASADVDLVECKPNEILEELGQERTLFREDGFWQCSLFEDGSAHVVWKEHFEFRVSADAKQVLWRKLQEVPNEVFVTYFLGQVLSYCLLARGIEPLHATAIVVDDQAIAFLGDSGYGKSTLAATFLQRGYPLLTDDVLALEFRDKRIWARPGIARVKLNPDSADALLCGSRAIQMNSFTSKMIFPLNRAQHLNRVVPLQALYVLPLKASRSRIKVRRLAGRSAFFPIIQNTFNDTVLHPYRLKQQFVFADRLTRMVPINQLSYPRRMDVLPAIVDAVLADVSRSESL